ncbi:hypothetical protein NM208_g14867 [Fusarium decemcellulare]|uniref:Uncharacterized protein n=1 Tax=Fusarium decemcellulare TaxID=57161 RepID=A0ACC1RH87_9HYPO|nr:hypothetical protein NM208_g14867 [Fusarium decemcellulare]
MGVRHCLPLQSGNGIRASFLAHCKVVPPVVSETCSAEEEEKEGVQPFPCLFPTTQRGPVFYRVRGPQAINSYCCALGELASEEGKCPQSPSSWAWQRARQPRTPETPVSSAQHAHVGIHAEKKKDAFPCVREQHIQMCFQLMQSTQLSEAPALFGVHKRVPPANALSSL